MYCRPDIEGEVLYQVLYQVVLYQVVLYPVVPYQWVVL